MAECVKVPTTFCGTQVLEKVHKHTKYIGVFSLLNVKVLEGAFNNKKKMMVGAFSSKNMVFCKISLASLM